VHLAPEIAARTGESNLTSVADTFVTYVFGWYRLTVHVKRRISVDLFR